MTLRGCFWRGTAVLAVLVAFAACVALWPREARAQVQCIAREAAGPALLESHGERKVSQGVTTNGGILAVFVNPETLTWSLVAITADPPMACLISGGEGWETFGHRPQPAPEADAEE